jgi:hypothetical protein
MVCDSVYNHVIANCVACASDSNTNVMVFWLCERLAINSIRVFLHQANWSSVNHNCQSGVSGTHFGDNPLHNVFNISASISRRIWSLKLLLHHLSNQVAICDCGITT